MRITSVRYSHLVSHGNYENTNISAEVECGEDTPERSLLYARTWVSKQLGEITGAEEKLHDLDSDIWSRENQIYNLNERIEMATEAWEKLKQVLSSHGVDVSDNTSFLDSMPF